MKQAIVVWVSLGIGYVMGSARQIQGPVGPQGPAGPAGAMGSLPVEPEATADEE